MTTWGDFISSVSEYEDKLLGMLFGQMLGDAIGAQSEFLTGPCPIVFDDLKTTDETDQMLIVLRSIITHRSINLLDIAQSLTNWASELLPTFLSKPDNITKMIVTMPDYTTDPFAIADQAFARSNGKINTSQCLARSPIIGCIADDVNIVTSVTRLTHSDPKCHQAAATIATIIKLLLSTLHVDLPTIPDIIYSLDLDLIQLDDLSRMSTVSKCLNCAVWIVLMINKSISDNTPLSFKKTIAYIASKGGDADNNCAVAGAILGAHLGYSKLPKNIINTLLPQRDTLREYSMEFVQLQRPQTHGGFEDCTEIPSLADE